MRRSNSLRSSLQHQTQHARRLAESAWVERLARFGYAAKGLVYILVGVLATQAALGVGGQATDQQGALSAVMFQPFGQFLVGLVAFGLIGYVVWRFVQAIVDPENQGSNAKGLLKRMGYVVSGLIYAGLALTATQLILGSHRDKGGGSPQDWTARLLAQPFGQWLVGTVGAVIIGIGFQQFYKAYTANFRKQFKLDEMSSQEQTWATRSGRLGFAARGVTFSIIGFFLIQAARKSDPAQTRGLGGALQTLSEQPYGPWVLGIVAVGLVAYGLYNFVEARYGRIVTTQR